MFLSRFRRSVGLVLTAALVCVTLSTAQVFAGTTGTISGTITDGSTGAPIANATVAAASPSGSRTTTTDSKGFYVLQALQPDTYSVSVQATGYEPIATPGITVGQDLTASESFTMSKTLVTIAKTRSRSAGNLVKPNVTSDVYTVSGAQLNAISGGNNLHKTLYQYVAAVPGITGSGFPAQPRIHGGSAADISYEFDGVPINDPVSGLFTTNLSNGGIGNVEVFTAGLDASQAGSGLGIINTIVKSGTYPGFGSVSYGATPVYRNVYETAEYGGATKNSKFSWYFSVDNTDALNQWTDNKTYPSYLIQQNNGPGKITTTDINANFHFKPSQNDDIQFLVQNGLGEFNWGYLMQRAPGEGVPLTARVCPGAVADPTPPHSYSGGVGGVAPNGQPCPVGLYFGAANTQDGGGNIWHHYSGIGKLQWNHVINDTSFFTVKFSENFNQYIFDQPIVDANLPTWENTAYRRSAACPVYPYAVGTPIQVFGAGATPATCDQESSFLSTGFWEERKSHIYTGAIDYTNVLNANATIKLGVGQTYVPDATQNTYWTQFFNADGTWPAVGYISSFPLHIPYAYAQGTFRHGKFLISPGVRYEQESYDVPTGPIIKEQMILPTFSANYAPDVRDVIRGSYTDSSSFPASYVVYRNQPQSAINGYSTTIPYCGPQNNLGGCTLKPQPTLHHRFDLQWERQLDANTSIKFGPYYDTASNIYELYTPVNCSLTNPPPPAVPVENCVNAGPQQPTNGGIRRGFGAELGINHLDNRKQGVSWWLSATYDNFWTNTTSSLNTPYGTVSLPPFAVKNGVLLRSSLDPFISGTLTMDIADNDFHLYPLWYFQGPSIYYSGTISNAGTGNVTAVPNQSIGWESLNLTALWNVGAKRDISIGIAGTNILNNNNSSTGPCSVSATAAGQPNRAPLGYGCSGLYPINGNEDGINPVPVGITSNLQYSILSQSSPLFFFFISKKF